ncbi:MAG TPA: oligosaccharide flippase family protein, partial [Bacteroidota bacterium]|nr:oligosaccharide flippase family protein [Bacteroidota bacterium]
MKKPVGDMLAILAGDVGGRAVGFLVTLYLARVLAPASFGVINIGLAVLGYLSLLGSPGIQMVETRNAAAEDGGMPARAGAILSMRLALSPLLICLAYAAVTLGGVSGETRDVIALYSLSLVPMALSLDWLFQGKEDFRSVMISRLLNSVVFGLAVLALVRTEAQIRLTPIAFLAGNAAGTFFLGALYRRRFGLPAVRWNPSIWVELLRTNVPAGTAMFLAQSVANLPPIAIGILLSNADAGVYSAGMKLIFVLLIVDR